MRIYPAIDLYEGKVVRLKRGNFQDLTVYSLDPAAFAKEWESQGAEWIYLVDLEGALTGILKNRASLSKIRRSVRCKIQFGGGLRKIEDIENLLTEGVDRVILGTKALEESFFKKALEKFAEKIAVGLDVQNGLIKTQGWLQSTQTPLQEALLRFNQTPLETIIYTDIQKDGMLAGPNLEDLKKILPQSKARIILSGGISQTGDIRDCQKITAKNFEGIIIGKALYDKKFTLREAIQLTAPIQNSQGGT